MRHLPLNLSVLFITTFILSIPARSQDITTVPTPVAVETILLAAGDSEKVQYETGRDPLIKDVSDELAVNDKDPQAEIATMVGEPVAAEANAGNPIDESTGEAPRDKEEIWGEISQAISGLNDMVGDEMFRDLRRTEDNRMEVRVDLHFWQRVRYETRVDLKNDISNIWHLYVLQYADEESSTVYFIDDETNKTIDIFSQYK